VQSARPRRSSNAPRPSEAVSGRHEAVRSRKRGEPARCAGVDEAGRGPLAGPVVAAAVILNPRRRILRLADSKILPAEERERLAPIFASGHWLGSGLVRPRRDRQLNILGATFLAIAPRRCCVCQSAPRRAGRRKSVAPHRDFGWLHGRSHYRGDARVAAIQRCLHPCKNLPGRDDGEGSIPATRVRSRRPQVMHARTSRGAARRSLAPAPQIIQPSQLAFGDQGAVDG